MDMNPWQVESIRDFSFFKCPECTFDTKDEDTFQDHATESHPLSFVFFNKTLKDECFEHLYTIEEHSLDISEASDNETKPENFLLSTMEVEESPTKPEDSNELQVTSDLELKKKEKCLKKRGPYKHNPEYKCLKCDVVFIGENSLNEHIFFFHEDKTRECYVDLGEKWTITDSNMQLQNAIENCNELNDDANLDNMNNSDNLKSSDSSETEESDDSEEDKKENIVNSNTCSICGKQFVSDNYLYQHVSKVHKKIKPLKRQIDSGLTRFVDKSIHRKPKEKVYTDVQEEKKSLECSTCDYVGKCKLQLKLHIDDVHEGKKPKPFLCTICGLTLKSKYQLKFHTENVHQGKKPHVCTACGKAFAFSFHLKEHISTIHEKIKSHQCPVCGRRFGVKQNLDNHIRGVHEKNKPHKCTLCEYACTQRNQLQSHIKEVHEENKPFECSLCNSKFGLKHRLSRHIKEVHTKEDRQTCSLCKRTFSNISNLNGHIASVHEGKKSKKSQKKNQPVVE